MCLAQRKAPGRNEAAGALEVLGLLDLEGCMLPRMHCTAIATLPPRCSSGVRITCWRSRRTRASCSLRPLGAMRAAEPAALPNGANPPLTIAASGGARPSCAIPLAAVQKFPGVVALARITSRRRVLGACAEPPQVRYFLLSKYIPAKQLLRIVRSIWGIENQLHWVLDVVFNEDRNRTRKDNAPENLAILRKLALNLVRSHPAATSLARNQTRGVGDTFLLGMLGHMR